MPAPMRPKAASSTPRCPSVRGPCCKRLVAPLGEAGADADALLHALMAGHWDAAGRGIDQAAAHAGEHALDWADLLQRLAHGLERGSRLWTSARKKDSLVRVLNGSRSDAQRLQRARAPPAGRLGSRDR